MSERVGRTMRNDREGAGRNKEVGARQMMEGLAGHCSGHRDIGPKTSATQCCKLRRVET